MIYLITADFNGIIKADQLVTLTEGVDATLDSLELTAMSEAEPYLKERFDIANIWNKTGTARYAFLVTILVDMLLYHLYSNINPTKIPELRHDRYTRGISWLKEIRDGRMTPNLPVLPDNAGSDNAQWGSDDPLGHGY